MSKFKAVAHEDIPNHRIVVLTVNGKTEEDDRIRIRLAKEGETPDFVSTDDLEEGKEITVTITNKTSWAVEAGEDIRNGVSVGIGEDGKLIEAVDGKVPQIGYSIQPAKNGDVIEYIRNVKSGKGAKGAKGDPGKDGKDGVDGKDGFPTEEQWNELVARVEALEE